MNSAVRPRNSAKLKVLRFLAETGGYVRPGQLQPLFALRSYRNIYNIMTRLTRWELVTRRNGPLGLDWEITDKGKIRLDYFLQKGIGA